MKFVPPPLPAEDEMRVVVGEYFTRRDVPCDFCGASPGQRCVPCTATCGHEIAFETCGCGRIVPFDHAQRRRLWRRCVQVLDARGRLERQLVPEGFPSWGTLYEYGSRYALLIVRPLTAKKKRRRK